MKNFKTYPIAELSYTVKSDNDVTPSQPKNKDKPTQSESALSTLDEQSSSLLISHQEVLEMFQVTSKATIYKWRQNRGFPDPVTMMPLRWLRCAIDDWKMQVGGYGK